MNETNASREWVKRINRNSILNLIKSRAPISRSEIATRSGLSPATVSNLVGELIEEGLVHEVGAAAASRGRPPMLLKLNNRAGYVVGVKVRGDSVTAVLTDLDAEVLAYQIMDLPERDRREQPPARVQAEAPMDPYPVIDTVSALVTATIASSGVSPSRVLGVGIGLAGLIDGLAGVVRYSPVFGWRDLNLADPLRSALGFDVFLENDVNTLTVAEQWFGRGHGCDHFAVVTVGTGIGVGLVVNGQFYGGLGGGAGELGHMTVSPRGPVCACGKRGCLEALASDRAVVAHARREMRAGRRTAMRDAASLNIDELAVAADEGDPLARQVLGTAGRWLGMGIAALVNLLSPELVIVGGEGVAAGRWRLDPMRDAFRKHAFDGLAEQTRLLVEPAGDETWARGAACVVLGELYKSPLHLGRHISLRTLPFDLAAAADPQRRDERKPDMAAATAPLPEELAPPAWQSATPITTPPTPEERTG